MKNILLVLFLLSNTFLFAQEKSIDTKVEELLNKMTLDEKVGQMNQYTSFFDVTGPAPSDANTKGKYEQIKNGLVGSMLNVNGAKEVRKLQELVVNNSRLGIPIVFAYDVIHGHKTIMPIPLAEAASWDLEAIEQSSRVAAIEASAMGLNWSFAPMIDIGRDARWGRVMEGAGEDPFLGTKVGVARVKGFQGDDLTANNTIAACTKHFAGYGFAEAGREYNTADFGTSTLYNMVLPPFKAAVENDVKTVMNSFNVLNGVPATGDKFLQRDILKGAWGFEGLVVSDWSSMREMVDHGFARDLKHSAELAVTAGSDIDMESYGYITHLKELVTEGTVDENLVDDAVRRILKLKFELGLFDDPYKYCDEAREKELIYHPDHKKTALDMAKKSIVLLKNEKQLLPLKKSQTKIGVIGALAEDKSSPMGNWRLASDDGAAVSVLEGLKKYTSNVTYAKGGDFFLGKFHQSAEVKPNMTDRSGFAEAIELAKNSEVVIMVLGEHGNMTGEGRSRTRLDLPGLQQELLEEVYKVNQNIVLVLMNGRPLTITWADENIPAILEVWQLGIESGNAIAEVLFGEYNPGGKLPMSFPRHVGQCPIYYNHFTTGRPNSGDHVYWSHYGDESNDPLYPFGYGLSYTKFDYSDLKIEIAKPANIRVRATIKNVGAVAGEEVVQLYIRDKVATVARPVKELKGFEKISLAPQESKVVEFILTADELGFYDNRGKFVVEPGVFDVMVGTSSAEGLKGAFNLKVTK